MVIFGFVTTAYLLIALFACLMTYDEQQKSGKLGIMPGTIGYLACLLWPLTIIIVAVMVHFSTSTHVKFQQTV